MFGWISKGVGKVFGSDSAIRSTAQALRDGIDALVYTDEEKEHDAKEERKEARQLLVSWVRETKGQNDARKSIAMIIVVLWALLFCTAAILSTLGVWWPAAIAASAAIGGFATGMGSELMLILGFYFAGPSMGKIVDIYKTKKEGK